MNPPITFKSAPPPSRLQLDGAPNAELETRPLRDASEVDLELSGDVSLPHAPPGSGDPETAVQTVEQEYRRLLETANRVVDALDGESVDVHEILANFARETRLDQQGSLELAQNTIETNRRLRDQIYELVKEIQAELQKLQEEIDALRKEIEGHNFFEKMGEGIKSAFGGGDGKELQTKQANMTIQQGKLKAAEARLEQAKKLIEHGHQLMEDSVSDLKAIVERINQSIQHLKDAMNKETNAVAGA
jgi:gas vesicle protein